MKGCKATAALVAQTMRIEQEETGQPGCAGMPQPTRRRERETSPAGRIGNPSEASERAVPGISRGRKAKRPIFPGVKNACWPNNGPSRRSGLMRSAREARRTMEARGSAGRDSAGTSRFSGHSISAPERRREKSRGPADGIGPDDSSCRAPIVAAGRFEAAARGVARRQRPCG